jgi:hypothetical protein
MTIYSKIINFWTMKNTQLAKIINKIDPIYNTNTIYI